MGCAGARCSHHIFSEEVNLAFPPGTPSHASSFSVDRMQSGDKDVLKPENHGSRGSHRCLLTQSPLRSLEVPVEGPRAPGSDGGDKMTPGRRAAIPDPLALALARPPALGSGATAKLSQKRRLAEETAGSVGCSRDRILGEGGGVPAAFRHVGRNCQAECGSAGLTGDHVTVSPRRPLTRRPGPRPEGRVLRSRRRCCRWLSGVLRRPRVGRSWRREVGVNSGSVLLHLGWPRT